MDRHLPVKTIIAKKEILDVVRVSCVSYVVFVKQKTAYEIVSRDWSSDVCSSDLVLRDAVYA